MNNIKIWAHRGASAHAPENTLEAFQKAIELGAHGIELDVQLTKDGKLVVIHDERIDRTSDGQGWIKDYHLEELMSFNYNYNMQKYSRCRLPLLEEVLALVKPYDITLNIELKTGIIKYEGIEHKVDALVRQYNLCDQVVISSFNHFSLKRMREINDKQKLGLLLRDTIYNPLEYMEQLGIDAIHPSKLGYKLILDEMGERFLNSGVECNVWSVGNNDVNYFLDKPVNALIMDAPDVGLRKLLNRKTE